nr:IDEAL domain-containing protein [uncultured Bacillus sp.]
MKRNFLNAPQEPEVEITNLQIAEMILDKALRDFQKAQLLKEIDFSLLNRNKEKFMALTEKLKEIS